MEEDSITDESASTITPEDGMDLSAEDNVENKSTESADDQQAANSDNLTSDDTAPTFDADLDAWAEKAGHDKPETDRERKLLQNLRNSSRDFTRERETKKTQSLDKAIRDNTPKSDETDSVDPLEKDVAELKAQLRQTQIRETMRDYIADNPITADEQIAMKEVLEERVAKGGQKAFDYLTDPSNLGDWHELGKARVASSSNDTEAAKEEARQEEREKLAKLSKSGGPSRSAKSTVPAGKKDPLQELWESDD